MTLTESNLMRLVDAPAPDYHREWVGLLTVPNQELKATNWLKRLSWRTPTQVYWPHKIVQAPTCLLYTSPSPRDGATSRMPSSA